MYRRGPPPWLWEEAQGGARAPPRPRQGGAATPPTGAQRSAQSPWGDGGSNAPSGTPPLSLEQAQLLGRLPGCRACLGRRGRRRRGDRLRCRRRGSHRGRLVVRLGRGLGLLPLANTRGDGLCDRRRGAWGRPLWSGFEGMGGMEGLEALDKVAHRGQRPLGLLVRRAGQCGLELGAQARQGLQIRGMGKSCPQPGFIVPAAGPARSPGRVWPCRAPQPRCRSAVRRRSGWRADRARPGRVGPTA